MRGSTALGLRPLILVLFLGFPGSLVAQVPSTWYEIGGLPGEDSWSVWGTSSSNLFLAGGYRGLGQWDGSSWTAPNLPPSANRYTVFGFSPTQVYSAGQYGYQSGALQMYDGTTWTNSYVTNSELIGLWGRSPTDLFTSGDGIIRHFDGTAWIDLPTGLSSAFNTDRLVTISGGATRTFIGGYNGALFQYDGASLQRIALTTTGTIGGIAAVDDNTAFAVGDNGLILRFDGSTWSTMTSPTTDNLIGVYALSATDAYATSGYGKLLHFNGAAWTIVNTGFSGTLGVPFALSPSKVYIPVVSNTVGYSNMGGLLTSDELLVGGSQTVTPEPTTTSLFVTGVLGVLGVLGLAWRRKKA